MREYNFGGGMPDPESFPVEGLLEAAQEVLPELGRTLVRYPDPRGHAPLREVMVERFRKKGGVALPIERFALTCGSMQAINLVTQTFVQPGETVITEEYTYSGTLGCLRRYGAHIVGIPTDQDGMDMNALAEALRELQTQNIRPKFIYTIASNQNPTGTNMSVLRRERLISLAREHEIPIAEDDCYADLHFEGEPPPTPIYKLADFADVIYIGSFSKILGPGVRLGYLSASEELLSRVLSLKIDGGTSNLAAYIVGAFLKEKLWEHVAKVNRVVKAKRDAVMDALAQHSPQAFEWWTRPTGGLFIWVKLPDTTDTPRLWQMLDTRGVRLAPGRAFHSQDDEVPFLRIAFGYPSVADIDEGVGALAACVLECQSGR